MILCTNARNSSVRVYSPACVRHHCLRSNASKSFHEDSRLVYDPELPLGRFCANGISYLALSGGLSFGKTRLVVRSSVSICIYKGESARRIGIEEHGAGTRNIATRNSLILFIQCCERPARM
ncbi:uncharacterized protein PV06_01226 [Exophiala oligosperma]|uniref:Uncharacterized protein n=1 Tax=Exophiala oligosperma TaxID=215243 RepID=A0A0D2CFJ0_9EURO|nr:uncharacterized protein PV06_01226 [Exophiala oligosperma]KIW48657.1 hypothetical protein PV06_01226 [Exophiala oligosperma]